MPITLKRWLRSPLKSSFKMSSLKGVSVIICCFNSASRISDTLKHLAHQRLAGIVCEVIIIDNASEDNTFEIVNELCFKYFTDTIEYKIFEETKRGQSHARERGLRESKYKYVLFCDDDNLLSENYIFKAFELMEKNPKIGVLGGRSEALSNIPLPTWFSTYQTSYAVGVQALNSGDVSKRGYVWGAGMFLRKAVLDQLLSAGFKSILTGREGKLLMSGDDAEICRWFIIAGYKIWYYEDLFFKHFIPEITSKIYIKVLNYHLIS